MNYLLDTHTFLWFISDDSSLSDTAKNIIQSPDNDIYLSAASVWEMAIKVSLDKLDMPSPFAEFIDEQLEENSFKLLPIKTVHTGIVSTLEFHHRDPFDRLIIAQSKHEDFPIIGKDQIFDAYGINQIW